jgi:EAL domain-containing protein (putative c-di-GMP-specific phosphodiesterase class I)/GGDEF domain-containing protein/PAS domain-containing protein
MNLDDVIALAAQDAPTKMDDARARRAVRQIKADRDRRLLEGPDIASDVDLYDPLRATIGEAQRIGRAAELTKRGSIRWDARTGRLDCSIEMLRLLGLPLVEQPRSWRELLLLVEPADRDAVSAQIEDAWCTCTPAELACWLRRPDGSAVHVELLVEVVVDHDGRPSGLVATGEDATTAFQERQEKERRALRDRSVQRSLVDIDPVTGLLTRRAFADEVGRAARTGTGSVLVISAPPLAMPDEDSAVEARLSAVVARVLRDVVGCGTCGVLGRYEFGVLMPFKNFDAAAPIAQRVVTSLRDIRLLADRNRLDAFGGLVRYDFQLPIEAIDLLVDAETGWRRARHEDQPLHVLRQAPTPGRRREISQTGIRSAVEQSRFTLYAQPLRDLRLNRTTRHEILLRVFDDVGRPTPPTPFLELAEHVDEILAVDKWVINNALRQIGEGPQTAHYQINISGRSLADPLLLSHISSAVAKHHVDPRNLTIEITETAAIGNLTVARRFADGLRDLGCQLALDDFGSGNTPLGFLTKLPVDLVKIDGAFIQGLPSSRPHQILVQGLVQMCRRLGILTAAEYVQDEETLDLLRAYGLDFAQGFHVGQPDEMVVGPRRVKSVELELSRSAPDQRVVG